MVSCCEAGDTCGIIWLDWQAADFKGPFTAASLMVIA